MRPSLLTLLRISLLTIFFVLTACASRAGLEEAELGAENASDEIDSSSAVNSNDSPPVVKDSEVAHKADAPKPDPLAQYLANYLALNLLDRTDTSRRLLNRADIEKNGRLASKALYRSLGYRLRDSFVAMPPQLDTRPLRSSEDLLKSDLVEDLEAAWAMLDSTLMRLRSDGVNRDGNDDWVIAVTRRNLLQEAVGYWYQMGRQDQYSEWLIRLQSRTNDLFDGIAEARQNYDVQDLRDQELALLDLRADNASLFQFYSSEQARLYNRTNRRSVPNVAASERNYFHRSLACSNSSSMFVQGQTYLRLNYAGSNLFGEELIVGDKKKVYQLLKLARELSAKALSVHANRTRQEAQSYQNALQRAKSERQRDLAQLEQSIHEQIQLGQEVDSSELDKLRSKKLAVKRVRYAPRVQERQLNAAIFVLADMIAEMLVSVSQRRLDIILNEQEKIYQPTKIDTWNRSTRETRLMRDLLLSVYDYTLVDYLVGYERSAFINLLMHRSCSIGSKVNATRMGTPLKILNDVSKLAKNHHNMKLSVPDLRARYARYERLEQAMSGENLGSGYEITPIVVADSIQEETSSSDGLNPNSSVALNADDAQNDDSSDTPTAATILSFQQAKKRLAEVDVKLATKKEVLKAAEGKGFTLQIVTAPEEAEIARVLHKMEFEEPAIVYRSQRARSKTVVYKLLIGFSPDYDDLDRLKNKLKRGWIKPFKSVRADIYD